MEPVEIELRMKQNLESESKKARKAIVGLGGAAEKSQDNIRENIAIQKKVIAQLKADLKPLAAEFKKVNVGTQNPKVLAERKRLSAIIKQMTADLRGEEKALTMLEKRTESTTTKMVSLRTQMMNTRNEMGALKLAGKENTQEYRKLEEQLGTLGTAYRELRTVEQAVSTGGTQLAGFMDGLNAITGTITAGAGALSLFNGDSEKMAEIQTKLQGVMAISIGLMQVSNALHSTSAFRITTVTTVKKLYAAATNRVTAALWGSNIAAKALMATLTLGLSVAIGAAIYLFDKYASKQKKASEETKKFNDIVTDSAADQLSAYEKLKNEYRAFNGDIEKQTRFIKDNKKEFEKMGIAIDDINEAERFFSQEGAENFRNGILERAKSIAAMELAVDKYKGIVKKQLEADKMPDKQYVQMYFGRGVGNSVNVVKQTRDNPAKIELKREIEDEEKEYEELLNRSLQYKQKAINYFNKTGANQAGDIIKGSKAYWEGVKKAASEKLSAMRDIEKGSKQWNAQLKKYHEAEQKLKVWSFSDNSTDKGGNKASEAAEKLRKMNIGLQQEIDAAVVAAMQEGTAKKLKALETDYNKQKDVIAKKLLEIEALEKATGKPATEQRKKVASLSSAVDSSYTNNKTAIEQASATETQKIWDEVNTRFRSDLQNRLIETNRFYDAQLRQLQENITNKETLKTAAAELEKKREQELLQINAEAALREIDFETEIDIAKQQIRNRSIMLESDRQAAILRIQIAAAQKRLVKLKELQANGGDAADDIERTNTAIAGMDASLAGLKTQKVQELGQLAQQALSGIAKFVGIFDESAGQGLEWAAQATGALAELGAGIASGNPQAIISGALKMLDVVGQVIVANREANNEIREFNYDLAQQAIDYSIRVIKAMKDVKGDYDSIFIDDSQNVLTQGMAAYNAALKQQDDLMKKLSDTTVKTGVEKKKFLGITIGTKDVYSNLLKTYPKLIDQTGKLNRELTDSLLASGNLSDEAKDTLEQIIESEDAATEALGQVEDQLQSLVGSISADLKGALDDAFSSGTVAAEEMTNSIAKMMQDLATQQLFNAVFGSLFADLEKRMKESYSDGGDEDLTDDLKWFMDNYPDLVDAYNTGLSQIQDAISGETGVDVFADEDGRSGMQKGLARTSQDSIDELSGHIMAISGNVYGIREVNTQLITIEKESVLIERTISTQLDAIADNTAYCRYLEDIDTSLEDIKTKGVKIQ